MIHTTSIVIPISGNITPNTASPATHARIGGGLAGRDGAPSALAGFRLIHMMKPVIANAIRPSEITAHAI